jgi:hypothetical protein
MLQLFVNNFNNLLQSLKDPNAKISLYIDPKVSKRIILILSYQLRKLDLILLVNYNNLVILE